MLQEMSARQTSDTTSSVETLNVLTRTRTGLQYRSMGMENPPTSVLELTSLPAMSWMHFAKGGRMSHTDPARRCRKREGVDHRQV
ncbi:hypothetical protein PC119_g5246 [Phytophthora cactorum]|nr:hypothetical protein PC119_g5246 [Phytophthora cactorum]